MIWKATQRTLHLLPVTILLVAVSVVGARGQTESDSDATDGQRQESPELQTVPIRPPAEIELSPNARRALLSQGDEPQTGREISRRIAELYRLHARLIEADAAGETGKFERLLKTLMTDLQALSRQRTALSHPRFTSLYRSVAQEYEGYYGVRDSVTLARGSIFSYRDTLFASLDQLEDPLLEDVMIPSVPSMTTTVPMDVNHLVEQSISYLLEDPDRHLYNWMSRASTYFPMIERVLREEGVPNELKYLAMIESGLNPQAQSWASAVGMWQFMRGTARLYDLRINHWVDERRDPEASTRAAARHLKDLYQRFEDWHLAIAAYNCGQGRVSRALRIVRSRTGIEDPGFWDVWEYLPRETRNYVPMYIAAALVVSNQEEFDLREVEPGPDYEYDRVPITGMIDLETIASLAETDESTIRALNPEIRRGTTPPSDGRYQIRIPLGTYSEFAEGYANLPDDVKRTVQRYRVKSGDTLGEIAAQFGVSVSELRRANGIRSHIIRVGQELMVPVPSYEDDAGSEQLAEAGPVSVRYETNEIQPIRMASASTGQTGGGSGSAAATSIEELSGRTDASEEDELDDEPVESATDGTPTGETQDPDRDASTESSRPDRVTYEVRPGDTIIEIADRHDVWVRDLREWNDLNGHVIRVGQELTIYTSAEAAERARTEQSGEPVTYEVRPGDTISEIAVRYGVGTSDIRRWNRISGSRIRAGKELTIYADDDAGMETYQVRYGDSLSVIANRHGITVRQLKQWNDLNGNTIRPGQELQVSG